MNKNDDFVIQLNNTLKNFLDFFSIDLHKKVLEIDKSIESKDFYDQLKRVLNSLEQYIKKDISLFYIGFLGSYSSGKSSTINSLLNLIYTVFANSTFHSEVMINSYFRVVILED